MENVKIKSFELQESTVNKGRMCLVAIAEDGSKWVIGGNHQENNYATPYETAWDNSKK